MKGGNMLRIVLLLALVALIGCTEDEKTPSHIQPGTYQTILNYQGANAGKSLTLEESFGAKYEGKAFLSDGTKSCQVVEYTGIIETKEDGFIIRNGLVSTRPTCSDSMSSPMALPPDTTKTRNISPSQYEEYYAPATAPAEWLIFKKI